MSVFELGGDDRRALLESARLNISSQQEPEYTEAEKTATGAAMGTMRALAESGRTALKLAGAAPVVYDAAKSAITGENTTSAQDAFFKTFVDNVGKDAIEYWTPQAEHTNKAGDIIGGVFGGLTQFAATGFNPFLFGAEAGLNTQGALTDQGVNLETSSKVGGVTTVASAAGAFLPPSVGGTFIKKLASGAAINLALGAAERGIDGAILQGEGYNKAAEQYSWKDSTSAAVDAFMGAAFGVMPSSMPAPKLKEVQDSVLTVASGKHAALDVAPGEPATPASAAIHHNALSAAIKQVIDGEPVNVGDKINKAEFSLRDELPSVKQLRGDLTDLLTEDGRNQFAQQLLDHQGPEGAYKTHEEARFVVDQFGAGIQKLHGAGVSMDRLSQLRTSFGKPAEAGAVFNQYAGEQALYADLTALQRAKQAVDSGADPEQTRQETGWHKWEDGKWRFEIDDSASNIRFGDVTHERMKEIAGDWITQDDFLSRHSDTQEAASMRLVGSMRGAIGEDRKLSKSNAPMLDEVLDHPALFAAYPDLAAVRVVIDDSMPIGDAAYIPESDVILLSPVADNAQKKSLLLHEVQHAIQEREGFARGGSASEFENQNNRAFNDRANATEKAIEFKKKAQEADANGGIHPVSGISAADLHSEHSQWMAERDAAHERLYSDGAPDANNQYKRLAGEVEARDTQARAGMSAEERKTSKPYASQGIPDDQVIIRHGNAGRMNSIDTKAALRAKLEEVDYFEQMGIYTKEKADKIRGEISSKPQGKAVENEQSTASGDHQDPGYIQGESDLLARLLRASEAVGTDPRTTASLVGAEWTKAASYSDLSLRGGSFVRDGRSPEVIKTESDRLVASAKKNGFFVDNATSADLFRKLSPNTLNAGIEHHAFRMQGDAGDVVLRVTAGGRYGPDETKSPAQYLHRIEEYNKAFPDLQMRVLGVGQRKDGKSFILTAQKFVDGKEFENMDQLHAAMVAHGWESLDRDHEGRLTASRYKNKKTGAIISDVHEGNVLHDNEGNLYPIDVHVEKLPKTIEKSGGSYNQKGGDAFARMREWRKEDKVGINWQRYTGATGHAQAGKKGVTFFQSAYHGTPYKFDKFSLEHMGKGEGAQAYGWGLYFAGSKDVSEYYRKNLTGASGNPIKIDNSSLIPRTNERTLGEALDSIDREILIRKSNIQSAKENPDVFTDGHVKTLKAELAAYEKRRDEVNRKGGQLYKVDIPEDDTFLLWDKPLSDSQSGAIRGKLLSNGKDVLDTLGDGKTGVDLYKRLSQLLDGDEAASKFLHKHGINGIKYLDGTSRGKGDGNYNYVIFDDNAVQILETYYQKGGDAFARNINGTTEAPQGQINFGIDGEKLNAVISLFGTANKSTALHELSHNFLEIYKHLNQFEDTPASVKADYAEMRRLIGADDIGSPLKTEHHERFAQAFEQYTREGKAPTPALKRAFEHFKEWMTAIYQRAADLGAPINDDIRAMFDKMLGKEIPVEHFDPLLKNKDVQNELRRQAQNAGWAEVGGKVIMDENRVVTGRTSWMPKEEWYAAGMGSQADVERAVGKAIRGEKLSKKQQSIVAAMLDSPAHDAAREDMQLNAAMGKTTDGETPEQKAARMAEMDAFFDSIPEAAGVSDILKSADGLLVPQDDGSTVSARQLMESLHTELQESDAMPKVYDAAINCFLRG